MTRKQRYEQHQKKIQGFCTEVKKNVDNEKELNRLINNIYVQGEQDFQNDLGRKQKEMGGCPWCGHCGY